MTQAQIPGRIRAEVQTVEKKNSPDLTIYYANSVDILMSVYDVVLTFGQMQSVALDRVEVEQQTRIILSPQHLKVLARLLTEKVAYYELSFGAIPEQPIAPQQPAEQSPSAAQA